jgi:hypothetical protein
MKMVETPKARIDLAIARARVIQTAKELETCSDQAAFFLLWHLAFTDLRDLEDHRSPS